MNKVHQDSVTNAMHPLRYLALMVLAFGTSILGTAAIQRVF